MWITVVKDVDKLWINRIIYSYCTYPNTNRGLYKLVYAIYMEIIITKKAALIYGVAFSPIIKQKITLVNGLPRFSICSGSFGFYKKAKIIILFRFNSNFEEKVIYL